MYTREIAAPLAARQAPAASMGPGFVHPGNNASMTITGNGFALALQWGPGLYTREMRAIGREIASFASVLQWGPGLYTREMLSGPRPSAATSRCFNGARVCTPGKFAEEHPEIADRLRASMGPGFVHPGNRQGRGHRRGLAALQWGPGLYTREIHDEREFAPTRSAASMGPGFVHPGNRPARAVIRTRSELQWGPGLYTREIQPPTHHHTPRGKGLQWGPGLYTREIAASSPKIAWSRCFNGARVCTPGKCENRNTNSATARLRFNGARVCTPGKWKPEHHHRNRRLGLQWGPGLYTREMRALVQRFGAAISASMGPGFVHPGNGPEFPLPAPISALQWGPGLYTREIAESAKVFGATVELQWGPGLYTREINTGGSSRSTTAALQWGPGLYTREISASSGAPLAAKALQWGPGLYTREIYRGCRAPLVGTSASMGPGFVHPGNPEHGANQAQRSGGFNGARVCTPGK